MAVSEPIVLTIESLEDWASNPAGPVALHFRQQLVPVEGEDGVIFPPTYAGERKDDGSRYNIDTLADGTRIATIDSVGSQANRMEPIFKREDLKDLVPQIKITFRNTPSVSLLDVGHRLGDASVRNSALKAEVKAAFDAFLVGNDASLIGRLAPTSLVFGAWDSRGEGAKLPRIVQAVIRARNVEVLTRSAVYTPPVNYAALGVFSDEEKEAAEAAAVKAGSKNPLAQRGFVHVPAGGAPGGIIARCGIVRDVTVNLVALRRLNEGREDGPLLRHYVLGLALIAATEPQDGFLRQGCLLVPDPAAPAVWTVVDRAGVRKTLTIPDGAVMVFAQRAAKSFGVAEPREVPFDPQAAEGDLREAKASKAKPSKAKPK